MRTHRQQLLTKRSGSQRQSNKPDNVLWLQEEIQRRKANVNVRGGVTVHILNCLTHGDVPVVALIEIVVPRVGEKHVAGNSPHVLLDVRRDARIHGNIHFVPVVVAKHSVLVPCFSSPSDGDGAPRQSLEGRLPTLPFFRRDREDKQNRGKC